MKLLQIGCLRKAFQQACGPLGLMLLMFSTLNHASAQVRTWDNGGLNNLWGTPANWTGDNVPNTATETAQFGATSPATVVQNVVGLNLGQVDFAAGGIARTVTGSPTITLHGLSGVGIVNNSTLLQRMNVPITLAAPQTWDAASGALSFGHPISMGTHRLTITGANNTTISDVVSGSADGGLTKTGAGTLLLSAANTFTGEVDIQQGTLLIGANDRIHNDAPVRLSGGTFATGGRSDNVGTLTLSANSVIDLGTGTSILSFDPSNTLPWTGGTLLTIANWSGSTAGGGTDRVIFGSSAADLTSGQLSQIRFLDPFGPGSGLVPATILPSGEIVPIPEPGTVFAGFALTAAVCWGERRRIQSFLRKA